MPRPNGRFVLAFIVLALGLAACGDDTNGAGGEGGQSEIAVTDASVVFPSGANSAIYFTIENTGTGADRLVAARADVGDTMLHETREEDGLMTMHHVEAVDVGPGETVSFQPGGLHVMIHDVEPLAEGDRVDVELDFEQAGTIEVEAIVRTADQLIDG